MRKYHFQALDLSDEEHLFAGFLALAMLMLLARWTVVEMGTALLSFGLGPILWSLPIMFYQDVVVWAALAWIFTVTWAPSSGVRAHRAILAAGWFFCLLIAAYTGLWIVIYNYIHHPLTYQLLKISEGMGGIRGSVSTSFKSALGQIILSVLMVLLIAECLRRRAPRFLHGVHRAFRSWPGILMLILIVLFGRLEAQRRLKYPPAAANPEWALLTSLFGGSRPIVADRIPPEYLSDFYPAARREPSGGGQDQINAVDPASHRPMNVLMVVMESVGVRRLELYGAPYHDSPNLIRLASHGMLFDRIYLAQPMSSSAMAALFCSIYPDHDWFTITRREPGLRISGLPAVLAQQGYRTAYMHSGTLEYDSDGEFLRRHGFKDVIGESQDYDSPMDGELVPKAIDWIKQDSSKPFFLALWTMDTHHPYVSPGIRDYHVGDPDLNRYLNGIYATDDMIGRLEQALERMHLADNTLLVVTGDHGEAFREHGQQIHGFSVHEEEVHVPVLIVNPRLFPHQIVNRTMGRQIDLAPTLLAMLGYHEPGEWQGMNLLSGRGPARAYLFATWGDFTLGLIEGNTKYIFDFDRGAGSEVYDLANDPAEQHNLAQQPGMAPRVQRARIRVEGWLSFQNGYLSRFVPGNPGPVGGGSS
jgi:arylsulfatase A-like enzyme